MENEQIRQIILRELPSILRRDPEVREFILELSRKHFADRAETESRFDRLLEEMRRERERSDRRWEEHLREFRAFQEEQARKWEEHLREFRAFQEEQARKWEENQQEIRKILRRLEESDRRYDSTIGALGARWGLYTEQSFRNGLRGILEEYFDVKVINVVERDERGEVFFGRPDQVELDVIIKDGVLIICEIKSSMSKADMGLFERKARFYEKRHGRRADRLMAISPMVGPKARELAEELGIEVYSFAEDAGRALGET